MFVFLLSSLFLHLIGTAFTLPEEICNPIECFHVLDTLFHESDPSLVPTSELSESCKRMTKLESCVQLCTENKTDIFFLKGLAEMKEATCYNLYNRGMKLGNECANKQKFRLFSCIYDRFNFEAKDPNTNKNIVMCKRAIDGRVCDYTTFPLCTDYQSYLSEVLLVQLFEPMLSEFCKKLGFGYSHTDGLELKPLALTRELDGLADCLDANSPLLTSCIPKKLISTNVQQKNKLCSGVQSFFDCVEEVVGNKCNDTQKTFFSTIRQPVFSYLLPHCTGKQEGASPLESPATSNKLLNEVYTDSSSASVPTPSQNKSEIMGAQGLNKVYSDLSTTTFSTPNISEVVVVHQHVIITMTYKDKNAAGNQIYVCFYLIALSILFGIGKVL